jgi:ABC-type branched-subunit amino acid transport system ATPase component
LGVRWGAVVTGGLRAEGLTVHYGGVVALDAVDVSVAAGEVLGLVGANGAGKTTLLDCLSGHIRPEVGRVWLGDVDVTGMAPALRARRGVVRTFQDARLFPTMPVHDALLLASGRDRAREQARVMGLEPLLERRVGELSTGERKRLDLACALARSPHALLLDEPSAGVAGAEVPELAARLASAVADAGPAVFMVEHDLPLVWGLATTVVVLEGGRVVASGRPDEVKSHPALAFGRIGESG